jgi:hypothetical protein
MIIADRFALPGIAPHIDVDGAIIRTNPALHTARCIWNDLSTLQELASGNLGLEEISKSHREIRVR